MSKKRSADSKFETEQTVKGFKMFRIFETLFLGTVAVVFTISIAFTLVTIIDKMAATPKCERKIQWTSLVSE